MITVQTKIQILHEVLKKKLTYLGFWLFSYFPILNYSAGLYFDI